MTTGVRTVGLAPTLESLECHLEYFRFGVWCGGADHVPDKAGTPLVGLGISPT
jgi:hypothetical protein